MFRFFSVRSFLVVVAIKRKLSKLSNDDFSFVNKIVYNSRCDFWFFRYRERSKRNSNSVRKGISFLLFVEYHTSKYDFFFGRMQGAMQFDMQIPLFGCNIYSTIRPTSGAPPWKWIHIYNVLVTSNV